MNLTEKINEDMKTAMKAGDKIKLDTLRLIRASILEFEKSGANKKLTPEDEIRLLSTAIEQYRSAGRNDLADKEAAELNILLEYLPKQLTDEEIQKEIKRIAELTGAKSKEDFPKLMPQVMKELKGRADGKIVKQEVEKFLGSN